MIIILDFLLWVGQPLVILLFKKNQDMFCCFSKVDDMAKITFFQTTIGGGLKDSEVTNSAQTQDSRDYAEMRDDLI